MPLDCIFLTYNCQTWGMGYHQIRPIYLAIMEEIKKEKEQENILKLEKLNDVA